MSTRHENLQRWRRIAAGALDDAEANNADLFEWVRGVARKIVEADANEAGKRPGRLVSAVGLSSKAAALEPLRERLQVVDEFPFRDENGKERPPRRGERMDSLVAFVRASGIVDVTTTDDEIRKRLIRLFARDR